MSHFYRSLVIDTDLSSLVGLFDRSFSFRSLIGFFCRSFPNSPLSREEGVQMVCESGGKGGVVQKMIGS